MVGWVIALVKMCIRRNGGMGAGGGATKMLMLFHMWLGTTQALEFSLQVLSRRSYLQVVCIGSDNLIDEIETDEFIIVMIKGE